MSELDEIIETFELLGDWEARYRYLVELGEGLEPMPEAERVEANRVKACMSTVHVCAVQEGDVVRYRGDCDTAIIKGVVALLIALMSGKSAGEILELDIDRLFAGLNLQAHLSPARHVGIFAIVGQMKEQAERLLSNAA